MTSIFEYKDVKRKLKIEAALPSALCEMFNIGNLMLTDEDGEIYHRKDDSFEPELAPGKHYIIDEVINSPRFDTDVSTNNQSSVTLNSATMTLAQNAENILQQTLASTTFVSDSAGMLFLSAQAPFLINQIAALSSTAPDPNLISKNMPRERFTQLQNPESFQACLSQVASDTGKAYRTAEHSMNSIRAILIDLPDYFVSALEIMSQSKLDSKAHRTLETLRCTIEEASKKCKTEAESAHTAFSYAMETIEELCRATIVSNTTNSRQLHDNQTRKEVLNMEQNAREKVSVTLLNENEEAKKRREQAEKDYRETMQNDNTLPKLIAVLAVQLGGQAVNAFSSAYNSKYESLCKDDSEMASAINTAKIGFEAFTDGLKKLKLCNIDPMNYVKHVNLMQQLEIIVNSLALPLDHAVISSHIATLRDFEAIPLGTTEGVTLVGKAVELRQFLEINGQNLGNENVKSATQNLKASIQNTVAACAKSMEERRMQNSVERTAEMNLQEQIIKAEADKIKSASNQYTQERENAENVRNELIKNAEELRNIMCELRQIDIESIDLTGYIQYLTNALKYLSKIKQSWSYLIAFFDNIKIVVDNNLTSNALLFSQQIKDNSSQSLMLRSALKATAYCIQLTQCAEIYTATSKNFIMPVITGIDGQFCLTLAEAKKKHIESQNELAEVEKGVQRLINEKKSEFDDRVDAQMKDFARDLTNALQFQNNGFNAIQ